MKRDLDHAEETILRTLGPSRVMTPSSLSVEGFIPPDTASRAISKLKSDGYLIVEHKEQLDEPVVHLTDLGRRTIRSGSSWRR